MKRLMFLLIVCYSFPQQVTAQTSSIKKLKGNITSSNDDEQKLKAIFALCDLGYNLHPDTLIFYANQANQLSEEHENEKGKIRAMFHISSALTTKGLIDSSLALTNECLQVLRSRIKDTKLEADVCNQRGRCFMRKNMYKEAIGMGYQVISTAETSGDVLMQMKGKTLIGWAYLEMNQTDEALKWHLKALRTTNDTTLLQQYAILFANIALNYKAVGKMDSAFYYIEKAIRYARANENLFALSNSLAIQAQILMFSGKAPMAEAPLKEVVQIRKMIGDPFYIVSDMSQLGLYYANNGQPDKGIAICEEGIKIASQFGLGTKLLFLYSTLAENYKAVPNPAKYAVVLEKIIALKDSVFQANSAEALAEMQAKYELQRKENIIIQQKLLLVKKNYWMYGSLLLLLFGIIFSYLLFRSYRKKQKMKVELMIEEEKRLSSEAVLHAEENERKRIAADLHDNMGAYASAISANVDELMMQHNTDNSVLQSMKGNVTDIMMNLRDTIWVLNREAIFIIGISDRFKAYVNKIGRSYEGINIEIVEKITNNVSLSPEKSLNMLRIMQEAFHNAIRHSHCTEILIEIISDARLLVRVSDNGTGFDIDAENIYGNGLNNMQQRAKNNGWKLVIKNLVPEGTEIELIGG